MKRIAARRLWVLGAVVGALVFQGCGSSAGAAAKVSAWHPLQRQPYDGATTFLFDAATARKQPPGKGGLMIGNETAANRPWQSNSEVVATPGRFRLGVRSVNASFGYLWMPSSGILAPGAFTIEFWVKSSQPFALASGSPVGVSGVTFTFSRGDVDVGYADEDRYPALATGVSADVSALPAGRWEEFAVTYSAGRLVLYVNSRKAAEQDAVPAPQVWSDDNRAAGLTLAGSRGVGATGLAISDVRVSRIARTPDVGMHVQSRLTVTAHPTGSRIRQSLLGGLAHLTTPATERMARGVLRVIRTDKLLNSTPIKVGAPDAAHRTAGISGAYSYNWAVVDRTMRYLKRLGVEPYISVDSTPQLLGGASPPFSGQKLRTAQSYHGPFNGQVPNDLHAWQLMVKDLAFRILKQDRIPVAYWSVWNEPDLGADFWSGKLSQYLALYQATVDGIRSVDPRATVGGGEFDRWDAQWVGGLMSFVATQHLPLNFISWHYYTGDLGEIDEARATVAALARRDGIRSPFLNVGEWAWQLANVPGSGAGPFIKQNYFLNDWSGAFIATSLIEMEHDGVSVGIYTNPVATRTGMGYIASGLMSPDGPWAGINVYRLWHMLPPGQVRTSLDADPGIFAVAGRSRRQTDALVASLHYQTGRRYALTVQMPRRLRGRRARIWLIDARHADAYDAGSRHAQLRPSVVRLSTAAQLHLMLAARAVVLVQVLT